MTRKAKKPIPKAEIVIQNLGYLLWITTHSNDAYHLIKQYAPEFGDYFEPSKIDNHHTLFIRPGFDANEVEEYLKQVVES